MEVRIDGRDGGGRRDGNTHRDHDREAREVGRSDLTGARARFRDGAMFARWEGVGAHRVRLRFRGVARGFAEAAEPLGGEGRGVAWRGGWRARGVASGESGGGRIVSGSGARARRGYRVAGREVDRGGGGEGRGESGASGWRTHPIPRRGAARGSRARSSLRLLARHLSRGVCGRRVEAIQRSARFANGERAATRRDARFARDLRRRARPRPVGIRVGTVAHLRARPNPSC